MSAKRNRESRAERQARTRAELIAAAAEVFARRGYDGASVEEIAEQAGYSHGAVYSNFDGKADLFLAVFEDYMAERARELAATQVDLPGDAPLKARARALADQWMERFSEDRASVVLHMEFIAHAGRDPELAGRFGTRSAALREAVAHYIAGYQQEAGTDFPCRRTTWRWCCGRSGSASRSKRWSAPRRCARTSTATSSNCWSRCRAKTVPRNRRRSGGGERSRDRARRQLSNDDT